MKHFTCSNSFKFLFACSSRKSTVAYLADQVSKCFCRKMIAVKVFLHNLALSNSEQTLSHAKALPFAGDQEK